ncbi:MAG: hypothetical protein HYR85_11960 [Planctomycetes bacterium]|nr:hypothetical protein [Planctomycetota bacterium]MBI3843928.1 hypothetical protein [Planctomycetota bacterium]
MTDVLAVLDAPNLIRYDGTDRLERPKWLVRGPAAGEFELELVCILDIDEQGHFTIFATTY